MERVYLFQLLKLLFLVRFFSFSHEHFPFSEDHLLISINKVNSFNVLFLALLQGDICLSGIQSIFPTRYVKLCLFTLAAVLSSRPAAGIQVN
jgi:hypothetical protein